MSKDFKTQQKLQNASKAVGSLSKQSRNFQNYIHRTVSKIPNAFQLVEKLPEDIKAV